MKLLELLKSEHSKRQTDRIVNWVGSSAERFSRLVNIYLKGPYRITQRAAWAISYCVASHPPLIKPHLWKLVRFMQQPDHHPSVKRNTLRLMQYISIPPSLKGEVADLCFAIVRSHQEPIAIKVFALTVLTKLAIEFPDLKNELIPLIEDQLPYASPGFRSRARKSLTVLKL